MTRLPMAVVLTPRAAAAQGRARPRIGILSGGPAVDLRPLVDAFRHELRGLGWTPDTVTVLEPLTAEGRNERLPALAAAALKADPSVIVAFNAPTVRALKAATTTIPIVMWGVGDPVEYGLVASLARPGGNVTGTSYLVNEVAGKLVELLKELLPAATSVALLMNPDNPGSAPYVRAAQSAGHVVGVRAHVLEVRTPDDFERAFADIARERASGIVLPPEPLVRSQRARVAAFALRQRLPVLLHGSLPLAPDGVVVLGAKGSEYPRIVASYVDRILRGARPDDLPIYQPTEFELGLNMKMAKALGLTVPSSLRLRADQVIE